MSLLKSVASLHAELPSHRLTRLYAQLLLRKLCKYSMFKDHLHANTRATYPYKISCPGRCHGTVKATTLCRACCSAVNRLPERPQCPARYLYQVSARLQRWVMWSATEKKPLTLLTSTLPSRTNSFACGLCGIATGPWVGGASMETLAVSLPERTFSDMPPLL